MSFNILFRNYIFIAFLCILGIPRTFATQADTELTIGVVIPQQAEQLSNQAINLVENKLNSILAAEGIASDLCGNIIMMPKFVIIDVQVAEGGMKNYFSYEVEMTLYIGQATTNRVFGTCTKNLNGTGTTREKAFFDALKKINPRDNAYSIFISSSKDKIREYYTKNLTAILKTARQLAETENYGEALNLLFQIPSNLPSYSQVQDAIQNVYTDLVNHDAQESLQLARSYAASGNYNDALQTLSCINPNSQYFVKASEMINEIKDRIKEDTATTLQLQQEQERKEYNLEKARIDAAREAAVEWAKASKQDIYVTYKSLW